MPHRTVLLLSGLLLTAACTAPAAEQPAIDVAAVEAATAENFGAFGDAAVAGDIEAAAASWTEDAHIMEPGMVLNSREAWVEFVEGLMADGAQITSFDFTRHNIFVHPGAAYEYGTYDETIDMGGEEVVVEGNYFLRWEEGDDGMWRMDGLVAGPRNAPEEGM